MAILINGKETSQKIISQIREEALSLPEKPTIAVIIVGSNSASKIYVRKKKETAIEAGLNSIVVEMEETTTQKQLEDKVDELNNDKSINGILVQLPLPKHLNTFDIIEKIKPEKDVDGFHPVNVGRLSIGIEPFALPCTPAGIIELLNEYKIKISGKKAVIIGRSNIVGKPISLLLLNRNATVTICHSKTQNLAEICKSADILIAAIGKAKFIKADWVKQDAVVIDVGMNRNEEGKLCGDVDFDSVEPKASFITPVPRGVGPMTIAMLLKNTINLYKYQRGLQ